MLLLGACALFELTLTWLPILVFLALLPSGHTTSELLDRLLVEHDPALMLPAAWIYLAAWIASMSFVEPLFVAAGFLIGDLVTLIYSLLEGELSSRFVLKVLVVGAIAGAVFTYYLRDLRRDES